MLGMSDSLKHTAHKTYMGEFCFDSKLQIPCWNLFTYYISSPGRLVFLPMVWRNFLRGCSNHENISKKRTSGRRLAKFRIMQYLAEPTAATVKGCGYALQQNLEKTTKNWSEVHALFFGLTSVSWTWESHVWKEFRLEHLKSDIVRIQDPKSKTFKKLFLDPGQASWVQIQDPRSTILKTNFCWIQGRILGSDFCPGSKKSFFKILDLGSVGPGIPSLTAVQTWKSQVCRPTCYL